MVLSDVKASAEALSAEIECHKVLGTTAPTLDELSSLLEEVSNAENDECIQCQKVDDAIDALDQAIYADESNKVLYLKMRAVFVAGGKGEQGAREIVFSFIDLFCKNLEKEEKKS